MSIRLRLTLLYSAILALTLLAFSVALYVTLARTTLQLVDDRLADDARLLLANREFRLDRVELPVSKFAARETFVQARELDGDISFRTSNLRQNDAMLPLSSDGQAALQRGEPWIETATVQDAQLRVYSKPVKLGEHIVGYVQIARSLDDLGQSLDALRGIMAVGGSIVTVIAFGIGWVLSGTTLRPINRITQTARAIGAERDFDRRVAYSGPPDEVGQLATTFNGMLAALQDAYLAVEQALQAQRRFVADASHELRTPLTTVRGNISLLQRQPPISDEDRVAALQDMVDETDRLIRLVNDLLVLARADARRPLQIEPVPIYPIVEDVCRQARLLQPGRHLTCAVAPDLGAMGSHDAIKQILLILLDNALKFTSLDGRISIVAELDADAVAIRVEDTGAGIASDVLPHIFERFYRGDSVRTGVGAGLGLAIARTLAELQHGTIDVRSVAGQGSVFTLRLPAAGNVTRKSQTENIESDVVSTLNVSKRVEL